MVENKAQEIYREQYRKTSVMKKKLEDDRKKLEAEVKMYDILLYDVGGKKVRDLNNDVREIDKTIHQLDLELSEIKIKYLNQNTHNTKPINLLDVIFIDESEQTIKIGGIIFGDFKSLFSRFKVKPGNKRTKRKGGIGTVFGLVKLYKEGMGVFNNDEVLKYYKEFKKEWTKWEFSAVGTNKDGISETDCESINSIFKKCGVVLRIKLDENKNIIIKK